MFTPAKSRPSIRRPAKNAPLSKIVPRVYEEEVLPPQEPTVPLSAVIQYIKGDKGDKGDRGDPGEKGDRGDSGPAGRDGVDGVGRDGRDGKDGKDGKDNLADLSALQKELEDRVEKKLKALQSTLVSQNKKVAGAGADSGKFVGGGDFREEIVVTFDGGGSTLTTGSTKTFYTVPYSGRILEWFLAGDPSGSVVIDIWKAGRVIPTVSDTITGGAKPTLSASAVASSRSLTGWKLAFNEGDIFEFAVDSVSNITKLVLTLKVEKV